MPTMVILVLDDMTQLNDVLTVWHRAGAGGATIFESSGAARMAEAGRRDDIPLFPDLRDLLASREVHHRTLFTVLDDSVDVNAFFDATERITGPLDSPGSGIIFALPVTAVRGLRKH